MDLLSTIHVTYRSHAGYQAPRIFCAAAIRLYSVPFISLFSDPILIRQSNHRHMYTSLETWPKAAGWQVGWGLWCLRHMCCTVLLYQWWYQGPCLHGTQLRSWKRRVDWKAETYNCALIPATQMEEMHPVSGFIPLCKVSIPLSDYNQKPIHTGANLHYVSSLNSAKMSHNLYVVLCL